MSRSDTIQGIIENFSRLSHSNLRRHHAYRHHFGGDIDLSPAQIGVMHAISHHRKMTTNKMAEAMGVTKSAISQVAEPLVKEGFLERVVDEADRRIAHLSVTHKGHRLMRVFKKHAIENSRDALEALTDEELDLLHNLSQKLINQNQK
jgi:DNA-binding MarR family transcriptional regulator